MVQRRADVLERGGAGLSLVCWLYLATLAWLVIWIALPAGLLGWRPIVITSGSMSPRIQPGDVVMIDASAAPLGVGTVITFNDPSRPGALLTHRIEEVTEVGYRTKGDANPTGDSALVTDADVAGASRLLVPLVGRPLVWLSTGNVLALLGWLLATAGATWTAVRYRTPRAFASSSAPDAGWSRPLAQASVQCDVPPLGPVGPAESPSPEVAETRPDAARRHRVVHELPTGGARPLVHPAPVAERAAKPSSAGHRPWSISLDEAAEPSRAESALA